MENPIIFLKSPQYIDFGIDLNRIDMIFVYCQATTPYDMRCSNSFKQAAKETPTFTGVFFVVVCANKGIFNG